MKYKSLIVGSQTAAIDEFFSHLDYMFESITSSMRLTDIERHLKLYQPQIFIACIKDESRELSKIVPKLSNFFQDNEIIFVVIGEKNDISEFNSMMPNTADVTLERPLTNTAIIQAIENVLDERRRIKEEEERRKAEERKKYELEHSRKHILVVDDDANMLKLIKGQLEEDFDVGTAISGNVALRFLNKKTTDLILLDYEMPGQSGATVLSTLRRTTMTKDIPVIFLTGVSDPERIKKVLAYKPQGYLLKPVDREKLINEVKRVLGVCNV